jgi:hypothetical protein
LDEDENPEMKGRQANLINKLNKDTMSQSKQLEKQSKDGTRSSQNFNNTSKSTRAALPTVNSMKSGKQIDSTTFNNFLNEKKLKHGEGPKGKYNEL